MKKSNATTQLKELILNKEIEKATLKKLLKEDISMLYHSLTPANVLKNTISSIIKAPGLRDTILDSTLGMGAGFLTKKIFIGRSRNPLLKLFGYALQFGISTLVMKNPNTIKSAGGYILKKILRKKTEDIESSI